MTLEIVLLRMRMCYSSKSFSIIFLSITLINVLKSKPVTDSVYLLVNWLERFNQLNRISIFKSYIYIHIYNHIFILYEP